MNAQDVRQVIEATGFVLSEGQWCCDTSVHFDSADAGRKYQGYVDSFDGTQWQVILLGNSYYIGDECTTTEQLTEVFRNMEALVVEAKARQFWLS